ncbi:MAG: trypsin-like serine protease [Rhodobacterales bacterium]|nr:trypsin-like serine protease [Rhodobacterales bacterium]
MSLTILALMFAPTSSAFDAVSQDVSGDSESEYPPVQFIDESYRGPGGEGYAAVVGGTQVQSERWDATVGVVFSGQYVGCTGTLIAPNVVLTAGHCVGGISDVVIGSKDWATDSGNKVEVIAVKETIEYPSSQSSYDIAVLRLSEKSSYPHAYIGMECILDDYLKDNAKVQIVGFGVTTESGGGFNSKLNHVAAKINDADCSENYDDDIYTGCNENARPAGEITAGGDGVDACFGDSGGPLYLKTDEGDFVVGVTSRAYLGVNQNYPCRDGGIWVRPDAVFKWIEESAGRNIPLFSCNTAATVTAEVLLAKKHKSGSVALLVTDPDANPNGDTPLYEIVQEAEFGTATIDGNGVITYTPNDDFVGDDTVTVSVTDAGANHLYKHSGDPVSTELDVAIEVTKGGPLGGCGCQASNGAPLGWWALLVGLIGLRRRR